MPQPCKTLLLLVAFVALIHSAAAQKAPRPEVPLTPEERTSVIEGAIAKLNEFYVFPETAEKMAAALRAHFALKDYDTLATGKDFARKLTADLREVSRDKHLSVNFMPAGAPDRAPGEHTPEELKAHREFLEKINFGFEKAERMQGNIGYIDIRGFVPPDLGGETATATMTFIANTDALIVDLRRNRGGEPAMIAYVLSYLFDEPTHLNDIWERKDNKTQQWWTMPRVPGLRFGGKKPVFVLTSKDTFSGGEEFAYNLKNLKRATLIGETTKGGAHPSQPWKIASRFVMELPYARAINPITHTNWEGTGVTPDIAQPADQALDTGYKLAVEKLVALTHEPRQKDQLQKILAKLKSTPMP